MDSVLFEIRYAARRLRQAPVFTAVVVLTLALGIGANSAIFSVVNSVLLHALPYREPDRLVALFHYYPSIKLEASVSAPGFKDYHDRVQSFDAVAAQTGWGVNMTGVGEPQRLRGVRVSAQFFKVLNVPAAIGRTFREDEDAIGHEHEIVLSDGAWRRLYGADRSVIAKQVQLNGESYDIIGVMPPEFIDPRGRDIELWTPIAFNPTIFVPDNYTNEFLNVTAHLKPGVSLEQAQRDMAAFAEQMKRDHPSSFPPDWSIKVKSLTEVRTGAIRPALFILLGAVGFVLLIACANVANLLLARAASRQKEVAIRTALGAKARDLIRQLLTESLMLSLIGGAIGLVIAYGSIRLLVALNPGNIPGIAGLHIDPNVVLFTAAISVITGLIFGLVPALQLTRTDLHVTLKEGGRSNTADRGGLLVRRALVISEVALALTLLTGGGLLIRSFARLAEVDPGFSSRGVMTFGLSLPQSKYGSDTAVRALYAAILPRIEQVPGVLAAGSTSVLPFGGSGSTGSFNVEGYIVPPKGNSPWGDIRQVSAGFFKTLQVPLQRGRFFDDRDSYDGAQVAIVDDEFVKRFYKANEDPIGKRIYFSRTQTDSTKYITIVGVVGHTKHEGLDAEARIQLYLPLTQTRGRLGVMDVVVRTNGDPLRSVTAVREAINAVDPALPMARITRMQELVDASLGQRKLSTVLLGVFAGLALLLASLGIYGVTSYTVAQRTREIGVRVALGAQRSQVLRLVLQQGMALSITGVLIGLAGAFALTRLMASQLYDISATDPATFIVVTALLTAVALFATLGPALRATRVDPISALRDE